VAPRIAPVGDGDALRARVPEVLKVYSETRATVLEDGIVDRALKELCATYLAEDDDEVMGFEKSSRFDARERAALRWTHAVAWDSDTADAELWGELHAHFTQPELVELGYFIAFTLGQMHWLRSTGLSARA
jgi:alkylhydroperoxidase family enzyme